MKTIIFHIGSGKTGSSAIQSGLARYSNELLDKGIYYPTSSDSVKASMGKITSGNGGDLLQYLYPKFRKENFDENLFIKSFLKLILNCEEEFVIFSNEQLEIGKLDYWSKIITLIKSNGMDVKIIYYARHLVDHAYSVYGQMVKRSCFTESFDFYSNVYIPKFKVSLSGLLGLLGKDKIIVKIYEECKNDILIDFLKSFSDKTFTFKELEQVNRSLTSVEISLLRHINKYDISKKVSKNISDYLIYNHEVSKEPFYVTQKQIDLISTQNRSDLEWLNSEFFNNNRLKYYSKKVVIKDNNYQSNSSEDILDLCALLLCRK